jgi:hypothetical protein
LFVLTEVGLCCVGLFVHPMQNDHRLLHFMIYHFKYCAYCFVLSEN